MFPFSARRRLWPDLSPRARVVAGLTRGHPDPAARLRYRRGAALRRHAAAVGPLSLASILEGYGR